MLLAVDESSEDQRSAAGGRGGVGDRTSDLVFRNVDARLDDPVETWPTEALETAMGRGGLPERRRIAAARGQSPGGQGGAAAEPSDATG